MFLFVELNRTINFCISYFEITAIQFRKIAIFNS